VGDGGSPKTDTNAAINAAGAFTLPFIQCIINNGWAISVPRKAQTGAKTLAQKGIAGGLECLQVDGNDIIAVVGAMEFALKRARNGHGGSVLEFVTYRLADHTTADDARRYRDDAEVKAGWEREPHLRLRKFLTADGVWSETEEAAWQEECARLTDIEVNAYLETKAQPVEAMFDYMFAELPHDLAAQRAEALKWENR
jgi:pyruvate dehydrogenase E1 component alpha subunit